MNAISNSQRPEIIQVANALEWNALQVVIDDLIQHLEDVLSFEEPEDHHVIEERIASATAL